MEMNAYEFNSSQNKNIFFLLDATNKHTYEYIRISPLAAATQQQYQ